MKRYDIDMGHIKVLVIEDNPGDLRLIREMLKDAASPVFELESADTLSQGLKRLAAGDFSIVLLDLGLPDSQGMETLTKAIAQAPKMPIVVLTGHLDETLGVTAVHEGAQDYMVKGQVDGNILARTIRYAIERKQTEEALRESEKKYRNLVDNALAGIFKTNVKGDILYVNDAMVKMLEYESAEEFIKGSVSAKYKNPKDRELLMENLGKAGRVEMFEAEVLTKTGKTRNILINAVLEGDILSGMVVDITRRRWAEEGLRRVNRALTVFSNCNQALIRATDESELLNNICQIIVKDGGFRMCWVGYAEQDEAKTVRPVAQAGVEEDYLKTLKITWAESNEGRDPGGTAARTGKPAICKDIAADPNFTTWYNDAIERGYASIIGLPLKAGSDIFGVLTIYAAEPNAFDEDEKKLLMELADDLSYGIMALHTRAERERTEKFINKIFESMGEGLVVIDRDYKIISANNAYLERVQFQGADVIGKHCYEISHHRREPCSGPGNDCPVRHTFESGEPYSSTHMHYDKKGDPIYAEVKSYPMKDASGKAVSAIEILNDITDKKRLEDQLRHVQKMEAVGQLAGGIAHDFNNILTAIIGYASILQLKISKDNPLRINVDQILASTENAAGLTHGLLAFSRKQILNPKPVKLNEIVRRMEKLISRLIGEDIDMEIQLTEKGLVVMADSGQIEQVLMNLATNARDVMPDGGRIMIETSRMELDHEFISTHGYGKAGAYALMTVTDTGHGMDESTRKKIFEPFFTTKEVGKGTGLGLSIVYGIVKQHEGYINVYSELGKGTTFKVYLPLVKLKVEEIKKTEPTPPIGGTETVLLAEDDPEVRNMTKGVLEQFGYKVIEAADGEEAIRKFMEHWDRIHVLILDMVMPKTNGKEVYDAAKKIKPGIKALFSSGYTSNILHKKGILEEGLHFFLKPITPGNLLRKVREVLDSKTL